MFTKARNVRNGSSNWQARVGDNGWDGYTCNWINCGFCDGKPNGRCWPRAGGIAPSCYCERFRRSDLFEPPQIVAIVDTPHRFRTKRPFWNYSGLAVVTHMSAEYEMRDGRAVRRNKPVATRGLNRNSNRRLKELFVSAAVGGSQSEPYRTYLERRKQNGMRAEMARLTLARKIAAVALTIWKKGETFDPKKLNMTT